MRTFFVRSLQSVFALATVALLTGANDAGCGLGTVINGGTGGSGDTSGTGVNPTDPPPPIACPSGMVAELVCDPAPGGSGGGVIPIDVCAGPNCPPPPPPCDPADPNCSSPPSAGDGGEPPPCDPSDPSCSPSFPPPGCSFQCVPANQGCPPGTDAVTICSDSGGGEGDGGTGGSFGGAIPPGDPKTPVAGVTCWTECAPHGCGGETPSSPPIPD